MNIYLAGQKLFGAETFKMLRAMGHTIVGVSSPAEKAPGKPDRLRAAAHDADVPWMESGLLNADRLPAGTDLIVAAHSHDFIGRKTRMRARLGAIGYHPSLLPLHRGRDAVRWTIRMGDKVAGGSVYWLSETIDGGDIAAQDWCFVRPDDTPEELWRRDLFPMGLRLIKRTVSDLSTGLMVRIPQDNTLATWEPSFGRPALNRPDLELIGAAPAGITVVRSKAAC